MLFPAAHVTPHPCTASSYYSSYSSHPSPSSHPFPRRAYHAKCVDPPLVLDELPEDEGWLCPACDAKVGGLGRRAVVCAWFKPS